MSDRSIDGPADFVRTNVLGTHALLEQRPPIGARGRPPRPSASTTVSTGRGLRLAGRGRKLRRGDALRPALALCRDQGGRRSSGARLASHLRPSGGALERLEQLRALAVSGEAHPASRPVRAAGRCASRLRQGRERARLAACRRSRARAARHPCARPDRRELQCRGAQRSPQHRCRAADLRPAGTSLRRAPTAGRTIARSPSSPTGRGTTCAMPSIRRRSRRARLAAARELR